MTVYDLNREQLDELKQNYICQLEECDGDVVSYGDLANSVDISDSVIFNHYGGIVFSEDDFFAGKEGE